MDKAVGMLKDPSLDPLIEILKDLGVRHAEYEAKKEHYELVGKALLMTLEQALAEVFTDDARYAWEEIYKILSGAMIQGANEFFGDDEQQESKSTNTPIARVQQSWSELKTKYADYEVEIGDRLFQKYVFWF